jgi:hypothetical protein
VFVIQISETITGPKSRRVEVSLKSDTDEKAITLKFWNAEADDFERGGFTTGQRVQVVNLWTNWFHGKTTCNSNELTVVTVMM